ncbi:MAG: LysE family transporter [Candidatus Pacebacteria bacterium]|nr:LysE family transporter [Candidatus Paceibacterota bacterium]
MQSLSCIVRQFTNILVPRCIISFTLIHFFYGLASGIAVAVPIGAVAILCIRRSLVYGALLGWATGAGALAADFIYAFLAAVGSEMVAPWIDSISLYLRICGGIVLILLGIRSCLRVTKMVENIHHLPLFDAFFSAFLIAMTNPGSLLFFTFAFDAFKMAGNDMTGIDKAILLLGVFMGSLLWWGIISWLISRYRRFFDANRLRYLYYTSGGLLIIFGTVMLVSIFFIDMGSSD